MKIRIEKRPRSIGGRIDALADIPKHFRTWLTRMTDNREGWVYREIFWAALVGESLEYGVLASSIGSFLFFTVVVGIGGLIFIPGAIFLKTIKTLIFIAAICVGLYQLRDLNGPLWWADRFGLKAVLQYRETGHFDGYQRYGEYYRSKVRTATAPPLRMDEVAQLCELYHQLCTDTISAESLQVLSAYTEKEINYFYRVMGIQERDKHFNPQLFKRNNTP